MRSCRWVAACALCLCLFTTGTAWAGESGFRAKSDISFRLQPIGVAAFNDIGYRFSLFDGEDSVLLKDTYIEAGAAISLSPAYVWLGGYVEALPLALLQVRGSVQYMQYFGTFGFLYQPSDRADPSWDLTDLRVSTEQGGVSGTGLIAELRVTPRLKIGRAVALFETRLDYIDMSLQGPTHEPYFDLLLADGADTFLWFRPTLGYLVHKTENSYLLLAARYERTWVFGQDYTRDLIGALALWGIPKTWWSTGRPKLAGVAGYWLNHPTDRKGSLYFGTQLTLEFGAK